MPALTDALLSIVIPLCNEEDNVVLLTEKIHESLEGYNYQIVYVDDFSTDKTRKVTREMSDPRVHLISLKKNYGQSLALAAGLDYAQGEYVITMDGDLQNDPADIPVMLPAVLSDLVPIFPRQAAQISALLGKEVCDLPEAEAAQRLLPAMARWMADIGMNVRLSDLGCDEATCQDLANAINMNRLSDRYHVKLTKKDVLERYLSRL